MGGGGGKSEANTSTSTTYNTSYAFRDVGVTGQNAVDVLNTLSAANTNAIVNTNATANNILANATVGAITQEQLLLEPINNIIKAESAGYQQLLAGANNLIANAQPAVPIVSSINQTSTNQYIIYGLIAVTLAVVLGRKGSII